MMYVHVHVCKCMYVCLYMNECVHVVKIHLLYNAIKFKNIAN